MPSRNAQTLSQYIKRHEGDVDWFFKEILSCMSVKELLGMLQWQTHLSRCDECDEDCHGEICSSKENAERRMKLCHKEISKKKATSLLVKRRMTRAKSHGTNHTSNDSKSDD